MFVAAFLMYSGSEFQTEGPKGHHEVPGEGEGPPGLSLELEKEKVVYVIHGGWSLKAWAPFLPNSPGDSSGFSVSMDLAFFTAPGSAGDLGPLVTLTLFFFSLGNEPERGRFLPDTSKCKSRHVKSKCFNRPSQGS